MRIAMFVSSFPVWTETFILNQIAGLIDRGHDVHIYARAANKHDTNHEIIDKYKMMDRVYFPKGSRPANRLFRPIRAISLFLHDFNFLRPKVWAITWKIFSTRKHPDKWNMLAILTIALPAASRADYDIIHCQFGNLGSVALYLKEIGAFKGKIVTSFRGHDATQHSRINSGMYDPLFREGDLFLPVSEDLKNRLMDMGCPKDKISVLHSGIDCTKFRFMERRLKGNEPIRVLSVARLVEMKGLEYSIQAVAQLIKSGYGLTYTIVGDGILRNELEQLIKHLEMDERIHILGWMNHDDVTLQMQAAHIMVAPSITASRGETEGIPNAVKEAMAMGMPVVSTLTGGTPELVKDGISGFLVPERDVDALADRLTYLSDHPEKWPAMGRAGRQHVEAEFDIEKLNDKLVSLYIS